MVKIDSQFYKRISKIGLKNRWGKEHSKVIIRARLTKEKIGIHAYLCGDGWISARKDRRGVHYEIRIYPDDEYVAKFIVQIFEKEFGIKPKIRVLKNHFNVEIKNKPACLDLLKIGPYGTFDWKIPENLPKYLLIE